MVGVGTKASHPKAKHLWPSYFAMHKLSRRLPTTLQACPPSPSQPTIKIIDTITLLFIFFLWIKAAVGAKTIHREKNFILTFKLKAWEKNNGKLLYTSCTFSLSHVTITSIDVHPSFPDPPLYVLFFSSYSL